MNLFFDTEFTGLRQNTTFISIGIVAENGEKFYAIFTDYDINQVDDWIKINVIANLESFDFLKSFDRPILKKCKYCGEMCDSFSQRFGDLRLAIGDTVYIKHCLLKWLEQFDKVEFWSDCLSYDWVLLNGLLSDYKDGYPKLPNHISYIPLDICPLFKVLNYDPDINREEFAELKTNGQKHNALWDAQVIKACYDKLIREFNQIGY